LAWLNLKILIGAKFLSLRHTSSCLRDETTEMKVLGPDLITCKFSTVLDETPSSTSYLTPTDEPINTIITICCSGHDSEQQITMELSQPLILH
jgi:hypothetical protein